MTTNTDVTDVTNHPEALPDGDYFILCHEDGAAALYMPRADVLHYISTGAPVFVRVPAEDNPF